MYRGSSEADTRHLHPRHLMAVLCIFVYHLFDDGFEMLSIAFVHPEWLQIVSWMVNKPHCAYRSPVLLSIRQKFKDGRVFPLFLSMHLQFSESRKRVGLGDSRQSPWLYRGWFHEVCSNHPKPANAALAPRHRQRALGGCITGCAQSRRAAIRRNDIHVLYTEVGNRKYVGVERSERASSYK
ncbi:hypothetical protein BDW22DRAFT_273920 [Trametopsis cervina]|nr:hypothetical protein BDW22DRAFT_273920 [Trametopsis cervina]